MAVFFFISGFIWNQTAHINNIKDASAYLIKKTVQILLPFISWTFFIYPYCFQTNWQVWEISQIMHEFEEPHLWFLLSLYGYAFYFVLFKIINKWGGVKLGVLFWIISIFALAIIWYKFKWFKLETLYMPYFAAGVLLSQTNLTDKILSNRAITTLSFLSIFTLLAFWESGNTSITNIVIKLIISFATISIVYSICRKDSWYQPISNFVTKCGKQSLAIYVIHWSFLKVVNVKPLIVQNELLAFIPMSLFAIAISYTCIYFRNTIKISPFLSTLLFGDFNNNSNKHERS